ncbi:hypothetical protein FPQ18DRAFT_266860, partial [Pyronema domesticum]
LRLALCGLGGIGKTQNVLSCIYEYEHRRPVFWIHAGRIAQFEADYRKLGSLAKIPGHDDPKQNIGLIVKQWLEGPQSGEWILVVDNTDNKLDFYPEPKSIESKGTDTVSNVIAYDGIAEFIPGGSKGTIIVTTRDREVARDLANQNVIIKTELRPEQAMEVFYQHYSNTESMPDDTAALTRLLMELQYLPLAIVQVAAYLDLNRSITISRYLEIFTGTKESQQRLLSKPHHNIWRGKNKNAETILTIFSISFRQLRQQSKLADSFLQFMACIDRKAIPRDLLLKIRLDGVKDEFLISEALDKLFNFSILQNAKIDFGSGHGYEIHSLVHLAMQTYLESEMDTALNKASTLLASTLPNSEYENWVEWRVYLPHATALLAHLVGDSQASADLCVKVGRHLFDLGRYSEYLKLYERARKLYAVLFGEENTKTLEAMHLMGYTFQRSGRLKEAQELEEKVLEVRRRTLDTKDPVSEPQESRIEEQIPQTPESTLKEASNSEDDTPATNAANILQIDEQRTVDQEAFFRAVKDGDVNTVKLALSQNNVDINLSSTPEDSEVPPLLLAVENKQEEVANLLLEKDVLEVNFQDSKGQTALILACENKMEFLANNLQREGKFKST